MKLINEPIMEEKLFYTIVISISRWYFYSPVSNFFSVRIDQLTNRISVLENVFIIQSWACQIHLQWARKIKKVQAKMPVSLFWKLKITKLFSIYSSCSQCSSVWTLIFLNRLCIRKLLSLDVLYFLNFFYFILFHLQKDAL